MTTSAPGVRRMPPLRIGPIDVDVPVVLAPMAGVTNMAFRRLCREYGAGLYVTEMITTRALVERNEVTMRLIQHHESETPRSIQLYGVDPHYTAEAARVIAGEGLADHIDLNFGCPVPKVTRKGGGSALPWKRDLFHDIVKGAVDAADDVPVTVKMRKGIDDAHLTYLESGRIAEDVGAAAVSLHARTLEQSYAGTADWSAIAALKESVTSIPVLGNGDIWGADDAIRMVDETGCDGIVVGRGCLGRPWLFGELANAFGGDAPTVDATLAFVARAFQRHAELLVEFYEDETRGCRDIRKHAAWYFKGYPVGGDLRGQFSKIESLQHLSDLIGQLDLDAPYPGADVEGPRGRSGRARRAVLPEGWLASRTIDSADEASLQDAELDTSGG
ncbi:tRNA dihydrouridine synthase DusB [Microbacterium sp. G2-8]|uniref:tRNA dihydrouridine synthase DusB n=1 Tax=Microbacterium sp. G2-8 TaxID=2842454 RepID=UPI001C88EDD3|nr:tRNA dihydrouridine synthase DusB [Microbacterium sp. G2-8]